MSRDVQHQTTPAVLPDGTDTATPAGRIVAGHRSVALGERQRDCVILDDDGIDD